jgi:hypothetical protein
MYERQLEKLRSDYELYCCGAELCNERQREELRSDC